MRTGKARLIEQLEDLLFEYEWSREEYPVLATEWADRIMFDINHDIISKETDGTATTS